MDFFQRQDNARRRTKWLVLYFVPAIFLIVTVIYGVALSPYFHEHPEKSNSLWHPELFGWVSACTLTVIGLGSVFKIAALRKGGKVIAQALGGRPLNPSSMHPDEQKLRNVVEEMSIASGVPVPGIYILDNEPGINAFAAGFTPADAVIGVTRGAIKFLTRDELQGVVAHEFSHILNGDMRLNLRLVGWINGILCIAILGRVVMEIGVRCLSWNSDDDSEAGKAGIGIFFFAGILGVFLYVLGSLGVFFGHLIKSAVSRQREFLADASAVQFTRNPVGLAGALKKIGGFEHGSRLRNPLAEEASHMFFGNGLRSSWFNFFATHPPLNERIKLLDPTFDGKFPRVTVAAGPSEVPPLIGAPPVIPRRTTPPPVPKRVTPPPIPHLSILSNIGAPTPAHLNHVTNIMASLPALLVEASREPFEAVAMIYALLLSPDENNRAAQVAGLERNAAQPIFAEALKLLPQIHVLDEKARLPLVELALPALRGLSSAQYEEFSKNLKLIIESDQQIDLFEYALQKILLRHLEPHFKGAQRPVVQYYVLKGLTKECSLLLSALARVGHEKPEEIKTAFQSGVRLLDLRESDVRLFDLQECGLGPIDAALDRIGQATPICKKQVLHACAQAVSADGMIHAREAELLRAIADSMDCPIPPFINS